MMKTGSRIAITVIWMLVCILGSIFLNVPAPLGLGKIAGNQFDASDGAYLVTQTAFRAFNFVSFVLAVLAVGILALIWYRPAWIAFCFYMGWY